MDGQIAKRHQFLKERNAPLTIGFAAAADFSSFIGQEYLAGIGQAAQDYGVNFINMADAVRHSVLDDAHFLPQFITKTQFMRPPLLDGMVTWASSLSEYLDAPKIQALFSALNPLPMVDIGYLDIPQVPSIRIDNSKSMHLIIDHLVHVHGFSRIAFIGTRYSRPHAQRLDFFKQEMDNFSLAWDEHSIFLAESLDATDIAAQVERITTLSALDAIVTSSDIIAAHVIEELEKRHIFVPDDITVIGFNNQLIGITAPVPVTTIDLAYFKRGYKAVEMLLDRIMHPQAQMDDLRVGTTLVIRQSCGCFEHAVLTALQPPEPPAQSVPSPSASEYEIRAFLDGVAETVFPQEEKDIRQLLANAIFADLYQTDAPAPSQLLKGFRSMLKKRHASAFRAVDWETHISTLRRTLMPLVQSNDERRDRLEGICNALRVLYAESLRYDMIARTSNERTNMTNFALSLASVETTRQLENVLRFKLTELRIPGIVLALSPYLTERLSPASVEIAIPEPAEDGGRNLPCKVREPHLLPKYFFPRSKHFSATLELLFYNGSYIGYAYLFAGAQNLAVYDDVKELLSQTLYKLYLKDGKTKPHALIITNRSRLAESIPLSRTPVKHGTLQAQDIMDYFIDHLDEMCDLEKMAADFQMSKSHLTRRVKALTGYTAQVLHERLKIEQAKDFIKSGTMKMNDIALRLGYTNPNYFSNVFKKVTGLSPLAWAERNRRT